MQLEALNEQTNADFPPQWYQTETNVKKKTKQNYNKSLMFLVTVSGAPIKRNNINKFQCVLALSLLD